MIDLVSEIDAILPQTQCRKCGYAGCFPYAEAISLNQAGINQCPPGGEQGIKRLAELLDVEVLPLDTKFGLSQPRRVAVINESECIGCTKCLPPCPVDAIIGANKQMHCVITEQCTGCELCIAPCPVNCISMAVSPILSWESSDANQARTRYQHKNLRLAKQEVDKQARLQRQKQLLDLI